MDKSPKTKKKRKMHMEKNSMGYTGNCPGAGDVSVPCGSEPQLSMVYSPVQHFRRLYEPTEALTRGTLFEELDKPLDMGGKKS